MSPEPCHLTSREEVARLRAAFAADDEPTITQLVREILAAGGPQRVAETVRRATQGGTHR